MSTFCPRNKLLAERIVNPSPGPSSTVVLASASLSFSVLFCMKETFLVFSQVTRAGICMTLHALWVCGLVFLALFAGFLDGFPVHPLLWNGHLSLHLHPASSLLGEQLRMDARQNATIDMVTPLSNYSII